MVAFVLLWAIVLQYPLFIMLFPDGGASVIRTVLNTILDGLLAPLKYVERAFHPILEYDRFPGEVAVPLFTVYFYLLAVVMASLYETIAHSTE